MRDILLTIEVLQEHAINIHRSFRSYLSDKEITIQGSQQLSTEFLRKYINLNFIMVTDLRSMRSVTMIDDNRLII